MSEIRIGIYFFFLTGILILFFNNLPLIRATQKQVLRNPKNQEFFNFSSAPWQISSTEATFTYRGSTERTGYYKSLFHLPAKITWSSEDILVEIHDASKSTPAVDESGVYVGADTGIFYKFSHEGKILWTYKADRTARGIHGTALLDDHHVYFGDYSGNFYCLRKDDGQLVWLTRVAHAVGSSPFFYGDTIIFSAEFGRPLQGYLVSLDKRTGKKVWTSEYFGEQVHSSPTLDATNKIIGVGNNANFFNGIDAETGQSLWQFLTKGPIKGTAVFYKNQFCFGSWGKTFHCLSSTDGIPIFTIELDGKTQSSAALDPYTETFFISTAPGTLYAIDLKKKAIKNQTSIKMAGKSLRYSVPSPIIIDSGKESIVVSTCEDTKVCFFSERNLRLLQKIEVGGFVSGSFAIWKNSIYFLVNGHGLVRLN